MSSTHLPLLLLDNSNVINALGAGDFKCTNMSFEETKAIIEMYDVDEVIRCFTDRTIENVMYNFLGIEERHFPYRDVAAMAVGQDAIAFKLYLTPSETQPVTTTDEGVIAKKILNVYVYCQYISRIS